jgi:hypothetical protein
MPDPAVDVATSLRGKPGGFTNYDFLTIKKETALNAVSFC